MLAIAMRRGFQTPIGAYLRLEVRRQLRNRRYVVFTIGFPVLLYVLYTAILPATSESGTVGGVRWTAYFLVSMAAYGAMAASVSQAGAIAAERASGWTRQLRVTPLPSIGYVLTKLVGAVILTVPSLVLVSVAGIAVNHVDLQPITWIEVVAALAIGSIPFAALGILLGYLLESDSAQAGSTLTFFGLAIFGGLFAPVSSFPDTLATIAHVLPSFHLAQLGWRIVAGQLPDAVDILVLAGYAIVIGGLAIWRYRAAERRARD